MEEALYLSQFKPTARTGAQGADSKPDQGGHGGLQAGEILRAAVSQRNVATPG
jgi:hypothetical protein